MNNQIRYLRDMLAGLHHTYAGGTEIDLLVDAPDICLSVDTAIPCGLLVAELATNAFKHAFPDRDREGEKIVRVEMRAEGERFTLVVADNGVGLPPEMDVYQASSVGLTLVNTFVQQLHGRLQVDTRAGTEFTVTFDAREGDRLAMSQAVE